MESTILAIPDFLYCQEAADKVVLKLKRDTQVTLCHTESPDPCLPLSGELRTNGGGANSLSCDQIKLEPSTNLFSIPRVKAAQENQARDLNDKDDPNKIREGSLCALSISK